jgi:uncharacterized membrane protein ArfC
MHNVNWWLMALAFVLGLLVTFAFMIRRVRREVPVTLAATVGAGAAANLAGRGSAPSVGSVKPSAGVDVSTPKIAAAGAAVAGGTAAAKFAGGKFEEPYGAGSARVAAGAVAPSGYTVKGNEDSMLYHTPDSPSYKQTIAQTIAEIWFVDEETATAAGFGPWHKGTK